MGKEVFIDANIFIEMFLEEENADKCELFLKSLREKNEQAITNDFVIYSCLIIIERNLNSIKVLRDAIKYFTTYSNLKILRLSFDDIYSATEIMVNNKLDFDDSLVIASMKNYRIKELASFDRDFDKVKGIERIKL